jgi:hypothetical protein
VEGVPDIEALKKLRIELMILKDHEDLVWRQRAREDWLKYGDKNTKFFHASKNRNDMLITWKKLKTKKGGVGALRRTLAEFSLSITEGCLRLRELLMCEGVLEQ